MGKRGGPGRRGLAIAVCAVALGGVPAVGAAGTGGEAPGWEMAPADGEFGAGRARYSYSVPPGQVVADAIVLQSRAESALRLKVYAVDAFNGPDGALELPPAGSKRQDAGAWIAFGDPLADGAAPDPALCQAGAVLVDLEPGDSALIPFRLAVPEGEPPGDHAAGIVAGAAGGAAPAARRQLYAAVNVAGELSPALTVSDLRLTLGDAPKGFGGGSATVAYTLSNSGNALVKPVERVSVSGPGGIGRNESAEAALPELLPGARLSRSVRLEGVPWLFKIKAEVRVRGMAAEAAAGAAEATAEAAAWAVPLAPVGAFLVLLAGVAAIPGLARARRRARARADAAQRGGPAWAGRGDLAEAGWDGSVGGERDGRDRHEEDAPDGAGQEDGGKPARQFDQGGEEP